jgi:hypothetical protein
MGVAVREATCLLHLTVLVRAGYAALAAGLSDMIRGVDTNAVMAGSSSHGGVFLCAVRKPEQDAKVGNRFFA